ncbi:hypothetical protein ENBRE01_1584 [Enteropsectra breve]|nr:hypothetical protein ENBRE01_1584 [Enteropsectra breve]
MEKQKHMLITKFKDLLSGQNEVHGGDVIKMAFAYFRNCNQLKIQPLSLFTEQEREKIDQQIIESLPLLRRDIGCRVNTLGWESAMYLRLIRSGLEFITEYFTMDNALLALEWNELMLDYCVKSLNRKLKAYEGQRGEYDNGSDCVDLRGVPDSHTWWCDMERGDSNRKFGR